MYGQRSSQPQLDWDDLAAYNTGDIPQDLPVTFERSAEGVYNLQVVVDPNKLILSGAAYAMLAALNKLNILGPAKLEGSISLTPIQKQEIAASFK